MGSFEFTQYLRRERLRAFYGKGIPEYVGRRFRQMLLREERKSASRLPWS